MSTLDVPDPATSPTFGAPPVDPAEVPPTPPDLPEVSAAEVEPAPDGLPSAGSACRWCGRRAAPDALVVGGTVRLPEDAEVPSDATSSRLVRLRPTPGEVERALLAQPRRIALGRTVREVAVPSWRCCSACEDLPRSPAPVDLLRATLGGPPLTPTLLYVAEQHAPAANFEAGGRPTDRGHSAPWEHAAEAVQAARELLAELGVAGGVPSPTGQPCAICGRSNSPYGWSTRMWFPASGVPRVPSQGLPTCDGWRVEPGRHRATRWDVGPDRRRVGCRRLAESPAIAGPLVERVRDEAQRAGADVVATLHYVAPGDRGRMFAAAHPDYGAPAGPRPPWWHLKDVPVIPPEPDATELAERLEALEHRVTAGAA